MVKNLPAMLGDPGSISGSGRSTGEGIGYRLQDSWASLVAQLVKNPPAMWETWVGKIPWRRERPPTPVFWPGESHGLYSPRGCRVRRDWATFPFTGPVRPVSLQEGEVRTQREKEGHAGTQEQTAVHEPSRRPENIVLTSKKPSLLSACSQTSGLQKARSESLLFERPAAVLWGRASANPHSAFKTLCELQQLTL